MENTYQKEDTRNDWKIRIKNKNKTSMRSSPYGTSFRSKINEKRLLEAVNFNNTDEIDNLLKNGTNPNCSDHLQRSPLHIASSRGYVEAMELLLNHKADPNITDSIGNTPLHLASCTNNIRIISLLINKGASLLKKDRHGMNPLELALGKLRLIDKFISKAKSGNSDEIKQYRKTIVDICDKILIELKKQVTKSTDSEPESIDKFPLAVESTSKQSFPTLHKENIDICDEFSKKLKVFKSKTVEFDSMCDQLEGMNLKTDTDSDVKELLSTLEKLTV